MTQIASPSGISRILQRSSFGLVLLAVLLLVNLFLNPGRLVPSEWGTLVGLAAPLIGAALASTPAILGGRGGIDVSVGPLMAFANAILVTVLIGKYGLSSPVFVLPGAILIGAAVGLFNGFIAAIVRIQPIVATLGTYLILTGLTVTIVPAPTGTIPDWLRLFSGSLSFLPIVAILAIWWLFRQFPAYGLLMATGSDDRAVYTSGGDVARIRVISYVLTGVFAGIASLSLTALIGSADPAVGPNYTLLAISSVALGGVSLAGGRGGMLAAIVGGIDIFLLQNALTTFNVSTFVLQVAYGAILVLAVVSTALQERLVIRRGGT